MAAAIERTLGRLGDFDRGAMRLRIVERYGAGVVADRLAALYAEVVAEAGGPAPTAGRPPDRTDDGVRAAGAGGDAERHPGVRSAHRRRRTRPRSGRPTSSARSRRRSARGSRRDRRGRRGATRGPGRSPRTGCGPRDPQLTARLRRSRVRRLWYRVADRSDEARRSRRRGTRIQAATTALTEACRVPGLDGGRPLVVPIDGLDHIVALATVRMALARPRPAACVADRPSRLRAAIGRRVLPYGRP